jgi:peptidyl-prolyl cis-trans isomerase SurA
MNRNFPGLSVVFVLLLAALPALAGDVVDRIVATVNGHIILQSDWQDETRYEAFIEGRTVDQLESSDRKTALDHLIDQELLREQMGSSSFAQTSPEQVEKRVQEIRKLHQNAVNELAWLTVLSQYGLTPESLKNRVVLQLDLEGLVDARLRPNVNIDSKSVESYYNQELLPKLRQAGTQETPLAQVSGDIKELLTQQKMNQMLVAWLQDLRSGSEIRTVPGSPEAGVELR